ncbi:MAG: hypothetical protein ACJ8KU_09960 [Chthoniobacterales bacterium]
MRTKILGSVAAALLLAACAQRGVLVEKRLKPSPFAYSNGLDGVYSFLLRDEQGRVHSQMVPPDVYARYDIGDYFDDQQAGPTHREGFSKESITSDSKEVRRVRHASTHKKSAHKVAAAHKKHRHLRAVAKVREENSAVAAAPTARMSLRESPAEPKGLEVKP